MTAHERLLALEAFGIKLGLDNMRVLVDALDHPERAYPTVHVAGTNGKGSVCAMVERALRAAGYRTGLYTSPHLDRLEERVAIDGAPIEPDAFESSARRVLALVDSRADGRLMATPTFFEATTALAFDAFRAAHVDVAIVEVGLGGRFDATNVVAPLATAVTSIAFDHERHLGSTLEAIAAEKAGIAKPGVALVVGRMPDVAMAVMEHTAGQVGAPLVVAGDAVELVAIADGRATVRPRLERWPGLPLLTLSLNGRHQADNAATALRLLAALDEAGLGVPEAAAIAGATDTRWPARLEWIRLDAGDLLIDAAHNPAGAEALASYLDDLGGPRLPVVIAAMQDKDLEKMVRPLARVAARFVTTTVSTPRAWGADALAGRIAELVPACDVTAVAGPVDAVAAALASHRRAVAAGSIYFVGPLRARLLESGARPI